MLTDFQPERLLTHRTRSRDRRILVIPILAFIVSVVGGTFIMKYDIEMAAGTPTLAEYIQYSKWTEAMITTELGVSWTVTFLIY